MATYNPTLVEVFARCLDVVQRVTYISSESHHGLSADEFHDLVEIANELLGLHMRISYRQTHTFTPSGSDDDDNLTF